jgi:hypothetical protein
MATPAMAGPPFQPDDPEPVDLHHYEFYVASQQTRPHTVLGQAGGLRHASATNRFSSYLGYQETY